MKTRFRLTPWKALPVLGLLAIGTTIAATAIAGAGDPKSKSEHWGQIDRNTIGSPVADYRDGPASITSGGTVSEPPYGKGSLGLTVGNGTEKADFGNEVDFFGQPALGIEQTGFYVYTTGENGPGNLPNIIFEIDPNLATPNPGETSPDYTSMVWVPNGTGVTPNQWSGYLDATSATTGYWYFTGGEGTATGCNQATQCSFTDAKAALAADGAPDPVILSFAVSKGRDKAWQGAVDGLRLNSKVYDFESEPKGTHEKGVK